MQILPLKCIGKWTFISVYLDIEHWLVEKSSTHQSRFSFCGWLPMQLLNWRLYLHQQVYIFLGTCMHIFIWLYSSVAVLLDILYIDQHCFACRVKSIKFSRKESHLSLKLIIIIASLYCLWCATQIYWVNPRRPAVGEEADLGVLVFLATYFFLPHCLCVISVNPKDHDTQQLPL